MIKKLAVAATKAAKRIHIEDGQETASKEDMENDEEDVPFDREALEADKNKYKSFWNQFGKALKLGVFLGSTWYLQWQCAQTLCAPDGNTQIQCAESDACALASA